MAAAPPPAPGEDPPARHSSPDPPIPSPPPSIAPAREDPIPEHLQHGGVGSVADSGSEGRQMQQSEGRQMQQSEGLEDGQDDVDGDDSPLGTDGTGRKRKQCKNLLPVRHRKRRKSPITKLEGLGGGQDDVNGDNTLMGMDGAGSKRKHGRNPVEPEQKRRKMTITKRMAPKKPVSWNIMFKVKASVFNLLKPASFKKKSSGLSITISRTDVPMHPFMPVFPHQDRCNRIANSVVRLSRCGEDDPSTDKHRRITPVMIFKAEEKGSCRLLYGDCGIKLAGPNSFPLTFPDKQIQVFPWNVIKRTKSASIHGVDITLKALSCKISEPFQAIQFGNNVKMNQLVFLFDFRYGNPSITPGTVAFADSSHFILDAKPHDNYLYGALVFDVNDKLVGLVYSHAGSPKAIQVEHLKRMFVGIFPEMKPTSLGRIHSLCDVPSPPQPHSGEEEAALCQDAQASTMDAAADTTLDFPRNELDIVYAKISPFIVAVTLESDNDIVGFVIRQTASHHMVAVNSFVMRSRAISVRYANNMVALVDKVTPVSPYIAILSVKRVKGGPLLGDFDDADPTDTMCEKVVTFFPYMDSIAMFKGHIILNDSTCRIEEPVIDFTFTCPYATAHIFKENEKDQMEFINTLYMTMGAPIFNLEGFFLGILNWSGSQNDVKFAMSSSHFNSQLPEDLKRKKSNSGQPLGDATKCSPTTSYTTCSSVTSFTSPT